jgi:hypothetical protein
MIYMFMMMSKVIYGNMRETRRIFFHEVQESASSHRLLPSSYYLSSPVFHLGPAKAKRASA